MSKITKTKAKSNKKIKCANCGKPFAPKTANAKYCSPKCKAAAKNAKKRADRKLSKAALKAALKKEPPKTACKVATIQKVKLPKPPPPKAFGLSEAKNAYEAKRNRFMLIGLSLTLLIKSLLASCDNVKAAKIPLKKTK